MYSKTQKNSFTLIEILVVATIIGLLAAAAAVSYSSLSRGSRDARRKADLEQIRAALEMYRSNNNSYPSSVAVDCSLSTGLTDVNGNTYLSNVPEDPKCINYFYYYTSFPTGCTTACNDYTVGAYLEGTTSTCTSPPTCSSGSPGTPCNYCLGPYGPK